MTHFFRFLFVSSRMCSTTSKDLVPRTDCIFQGKTGTGKSVSFLFIFYFKESFFLSQMMSNFKKLFKEFSFKVISYLKLLPWSGIAVKYYPKCLAFTKDQFKLMFFTEFLNNSSFILEFLSK